MVGVEDVKRGTSARQAIPSIACLLLYGWELVMTKYGFMWALKQKANILKVLEADILFIRLMFLNHKLNAAIVKKLWRLVQVLQLVDNDATRNKKTRVG